MAANQQREEPPALEAEDLGRRFGRVWAVANVSLSLAGGQSLLVAGHNGSGKSTLLRLLAGALRPDRGEVRVEGQARRELVHRRVALLGHASFTYEPLTALENLELFAQMIGRPAGKRALLARLEEVGLAEQAEAPVHSFSAGMRQRLAVARLLLQEPAVALLDEPHSALDPEGALLMDQLISGLRRRGAAVVLATHQLSRAATLCERGIVLEQGRIQWSGFTRELVTPSAPSGLVAFMGKAQLAEGDA
ncbi:MAG: heme ABC exporter ATP-binding protein CcmA [Deltaproteobacteria bacterium]|nr:heme ABC exporter ATP-binding protein CcmA [Deltaproteobacteria bacterium]